MITFQSFHPDFIAAAAELLAARHHRDRVACPDLPARFEQPAVARKAIEVIWQRPRANGVAAFNGEDMLGYLIADLSVESPVRSAWVRYPGHALAPATDPEFYRDLYAAVAARWVRLGCFDHFMFLPAHDAAAREALFRLSFGYSQAYALLPLADLLVDDATFDIRIRRAGPDDTALLADLSPLIISNAARTPAFVPIPPDDLPEYAEGFSELASNPDWIVWLAQRLGETLGYAAFAPVTPVDDAMLAPENCVQLKIAATRPEARGQGVSTALTHHGLAHARGQGYTTCLNDWHIPSLLASRFWPRFGFQPVAYRLIRRLDHRSAWADAQPVDW